MKRLFIITLLLIFSIIYLNSKVFTQVNDISGWGKTKWGMGQDDITKIFPEAKRLNRRLENEPGKFISFELNNHDIDGDKFTVQLIMNESNELKEVIVYPAKSTLISEGLFVRIEKLLVDKYGPQSYRNKRPTYMGYDIDVTWNFPSTTIELADADFGRIGKQLLKIHYKERKGSSKDSL